mmetsp:Transcript_93875/g.287240  ORF Transcript_93875/g.287240 Transcript_93875/m.287240 type:complete len:480 (-) Transcript_93875:1823-3262(-)
MPVPHTPALLQSLLQHPLQRRYLGDHDLARRQRGLVKRRVARGAEARFQAMHAQALEQPRIAAGHALTIGADLIHTFPAQLEVGPRVEPVDALHALDPALARGVLDLVEITPQAAVHRASSGAHVRAQPRDVLAARAHGPRRGADVAALAQALAPDGGFAPGVLHGLEIVVQAEDLPTFPLRLLALVLRHQALEVILAPLEQYGVVDDAFGPFSLLCDQRLAAAGVHIRGVEVLEQAGPLTAAARLHVFADLVQGAGARPSGAAETNVARLEHHVLFLFSPALQRQLIQVGSEALRLPPVGARVGAHSCDVRIARGLRHGVKHGVFDALGGLPRQLRLARRRVDLGDVLRKAGQHLPVAAEVLELGRLQLPGAKAAGLLRAVLDEAQVQVELAVNQLHLILYNSLATEGKLAVVDVALQARPHLAVAPRPLLHVRARGRHGLGARRRHPRAHADIQGLQRLDVELGLGASLRQGIAVVH